MAHYIAAAVPAINASKTLRLQKTSAVDNRADDTRGRNAGERAERQGEARRGSVQWESAKKAQV